MTKPMPRMVEFSLWAIWAFVIGGAAIWVVVGAVGYWFKLGMLPIEAASWVQAFGSIGAITVAAWAAIYATRSQQQEAMRLQRHRELIAKRGLFEIASRSQAYVEIMVGICSEDRDGFGGHDLTFIADELDGQCENAKQVRVVDLPHSDLAKPLLQMVFNLARGAKMARHFAEKDDKSRAVVASKLLNENMQEFMRIFSA